MTATLRRRDVVRALLEGRDGLLVVAGLGSTAWDCTAAADSALTFPMWGAMGAAAATGLGLALAQPERRVLVVTGDGEMLMGLGSLATIGVERPANLAIAVIDNERYGETGMQATHTAHGVDLAAIARACGFAQAMLVRTAAESEEARRALLCAPGPVLAQIKVVPEKLPLVLPPRDGGLLRARFRRALLGPAADLQ
ncbi:MAG: thiamine pyrophosphate-dependent enzyme [Burkholderiales bacterium]|nr:thiamine pyrophosphate-dependent enzyme [Burkholderiales bacterium]